MQIAFNRLGERFVRAGNQRAEVVSATRAPAHRVKRAPAGQQTILGHEFRKQAAGPGGPSNLTSR